MITSRPRGRFFTVSLFTREWIEILKNFIVSLSILVSLFTREWIEIGVICSHPCLICVSLFTREWIEIAGHDGRQRKVYGLPLYEGVD